MSSNAQTKGLNKSSKTVHDQAAGAALAGEGVTGFSASTAESYDLFGPDGGATFIPPEYFNQPLNLLPKESLQKELKDEISGPINPELFPDKFGNVDELQDYIDEGLNEDGDVDEDYFEQYEALIGPNQEKYDTNENSEYSGMDQTGPDNDFYPGGIDPGAPMAKSGTYLDAENKKSETLTTEKDLTEYPGPEGIHKPALDAIFRTEMRYHKGQDYRISNTSKKPADPNDSVVNECKDKGFELNRFADGYYKNHVRSAVSGNPVRTASGGFVFTRGEKIPNYISGYTGE